MHCSWKKKLLLLIQQYIKGLGFAIMLHSVIRFFYVKSFLQTGMAIKSLNIKKFKANFSTFMCYNSWAVLYNDKNRHSYLYIP